MAASTAPSPEVLRRLLREFVKADAAGQQQLEERYGAEVARLRPLVEDLRRLQREQRSQANRERAIRRQEESLRRATVAPSAGPARAAPALFPAGPPAMDVAEEDEDDIVGTFLRRDNDVFGGEADFRREYAALWQRCAGLAPQYRELPLPPGGAGSLWLGDPMGAALDRRVARAAADHRLAGVEAGVAPMLSLALEAFLRNTLESRLTPDCTSSQTELPTATTVATPT
eukprot:EG_transcript_26437